ncbi:MAG: sigma-54 dependent transcriptional regulator [Ignavibacteria bacterium]|jgi:DNA-binding NtrC family response regulator|nr:sigma-54 dependent transcriptional regulator [Ignavibacteria bacterium]MDH7526780.1 sigma-54 dependent transcriptional regulator [Ignavibacteria bacterium]
MKQKILIIDDDELVTSSLKRALAQSGYEIEIASSGKLGIEKVEKENPDMVLLDIFLGDLNGMEVLKKIFLINPDLPVVMITGFADVQTAVNAIKMGAIDFILKPINVDQLELIINKTLKHVALQKEVQRLKLITKEGDITREMFGQSRAIKSTLDAVEKIAISEGTTILIEGESGVGKEMIARYIHNISSRREGPFVAINCGAIPKELAESELFGSEKGAYTGASEKTRIGKFEIADGGTILLDEIGELSLELQVKLLRVLQEKKFFRLGGTKEISVNVRIIAATNKDLRQAVSEKTFREDLYYRLNVATIYVPPLRERKDDIPFLAMNFVDEFNKTFNKQIKKISPEALDMMLNYSWPGNVRELRNTIERAVLLISGDELKPEHLNFIEKDKSTQNIIDNEYILKIPKQGIKMDQVVRDLIIQTLEITDGNQIQAAKILGISRSKLRYRMEQLKIEVKKQVK